MVRDASESDGSGRAAETPEGSRRTIVRRRRGWSGQRDGRREAAAGSPKKTAIYLLDCATLMALGVARGSKILNVVPSPTVESWTNILPLW